MVLSLLIVSDPTISNRIELIEAVPYSSFRSQQVVLVVLFVIMFGFTDGVPGINVEGINLAPDFSPNGVISTDGLHILILEVLPYSLMNG